MLDTYIATYLASPRYPELRLLIHMLEFSITYNKDKFYITVVSIFANLY